MTDQVGIYNFALGQIGAASTVASLTEDSIERRLCDAQYDILRKSILNDAPWNFAMRYRPLTQTSYDNSRFSYAYAYPSDCIQLLNILDGNEVETEQTSHRDKTNPYQVVSKQDGTGKLILTDVAMAVGLYKADITNTNQFTPLFLEAIGYLLASRIAMPITQSASVRGQMLELYNVTITKAITANLNENRDNNEPPESEFITIRN